MRGGRIQKEKRKKDNTRLQNNVSASYGGECTELWSQGAFPV